MKLLYQWCNFGANFGMSFSSKARQISRWRLIQVRCSDGTLGWPEHAPYDAIIVAAGGPTVPESLKSQLKVGGRMVIPVGNQLTNQELIRITRVSKTKYASEDIADVCFVPLIGDQGWEQASNSKATAASKNLPVRISKDDPELSHVFPPGRGGTA